jgi:hypothetical protein
MEEKEIRKLADYDINATLSKEKVVEKVLEIIKKNE